MKAHALRGASRLLVQQVNLSKHLIAVQRVHVQHPDRWPRAKRGRADAVPKVQWRERTTRSLRHGVIPVLPGRYRRSRVVAVLDAPEVGDSATRPSKCAGSKGPARSKELGVVVRQRYNWAQYGVEPKEVSVDGHARPGHQ